MNGMFGNDVAPFQGSWFAMQSNTQGVALGYYVLALRAKLMQNGLMAVNHMP